MLRLNRNKVVAIVIFACLIVFSVIYAEKLIIYFRLFRLRPQYVIRVEHQIHEDYGLSIPVTFHFSIPDTSQNINVYKKFQKNQKWIEIPEKKGDEFFNNIEAARFDYQNDRAYISVIFDESSDEIYLSLIDEENRLVENSYLGTSKYYDNRKAVVIFSGDDWDGYPPNNDGFKETAQILRENKIWFTAGVITAGFKRDSWPPPIWEDIQEELDKGFVEIASHSRTHPTPPYEDTEGEVKGSKEDLINNLDLNPLSRKGGEEYIYTWHAPFGASDETIRKQLGENKYLVQRVASDGNTLVDWNSDIGLYDKVGVTFGFHRTSIEESLERIDATIANKEVVNILVHPRAIDWSEGGKARKIVEYVKGRKNLWYTGLGYLYLYKLTSSEVDISYFSSF